jgi:hypothetical protein
MMMAGAVWWVVVVIVLGEVDLQPSFGDNNARVGR